MLYNKLGNTNLEISQIGLGTMTWGEQNTESEALLQIDRAIEMGVNFIDTAEMYPVPPKATTQGATEEIIGRWIRKRNRRDQIILASKVTGPSSDFEYIRNGPHLNAVQIKQALHDSLKRLSTDYLDLYQVHWPERKSNYFGILGYQAQPDQNENIILVEETLDALYGLMDQGLIRHIGISNESPWGLMRYLRYAEQHQRKPIVSIQNPYNLLNRSFEVGLAEFSDREKISLLAYSPLAFGVLSGKYIDGAKPARSRLTLYERFNRYSNSQANNATKAYLEIAKKHELEPAQMALAFVNSRPFVSSTLIGATSISQLESNIRSIELTLGKEVLDDIESVHCQWPNPCP